MAAKVEILKKSALLWRVVWICFYFFIYINLFSTNRKNILIEIMPSPYTNIWSTTNPSIYRSWAYFSPYHMFPDFVHILWLIGHRSLISFLNNNRRSLPSTTDLWSLLASDQCSPLPFSCATRGNARSARRNRTPLSKCVISAPNSSPTTTANTVSWFIMGNVNTRRLSVERVVCEK